MQDPRLGLNSQPFDFMPTCPQCGEQESIRCHCDYVTREVDFYLCEVCGAEWESAQADI